MAKLAKVLSVVKLAASDKVAGGGTKMADTPRENGGKWSNPTHNGKTKKTVPSH